MTKPIDRGSGQAYWRSLDELADTPEFRKFVTSEFPHLPELLSGPTRRNFLKAMGASLGLAGLTACRWPREEIVAFASNSAGRVPGIPQQYATASELGGVGLGLLVTSYDGRPIKIEGNPEHGFSQGATDAITQASILELYDPDRSQSCVLRSDAQRPLRTWAEFTAFATPHFAALKGSGGEGLCVLSEASSSPSLGQMRARLAAAFPKAAWFEYEALSRDHERSGLTQALGSPHRPQYDLSRADVILSLDCDFLMQHPAALRLTRAFTQRRDGAAQGKMNRLYVLEATHSITGSNADERAALRSSDIAAAAVQIAAGLAAKSVALPGAAATLAGATVKVLDAALLDAIVSDLVAHRGHSLILAGEAQPPEVHALCAALNEALGNVGQTVHYAAEPDAQRPTHVEAISTLCERMKAGAVKTLVLIGGNPVYDAPADLDFAAALAKVPTSIHLGYYYDETGREALWHVNRAHFLESWGDVCAYDGTVSVVQPLVAPIYDGKSAIELLALLTADELNNGYDIVRRTLKQQAAADVADFELVWRQWLNAGVIAGSAWAVSAAKVSGDAWIAPLMARVQSSAGKAGGALELVFRGDYKVYDGRFANNGWLQELPDPMSKLVWDNALYLAPSTAAKLGVRKKGQFVRIDVGGKTLEVPAFVMPGHAADSLSLALGWGRRNGGAVARGAGFNAYPLRTRANWYIATGVQATSPGSAYKLIGTQDHHAITTEVGDAETAKRVPKLIREVSEAAFRKNPKLISDFVHHLPQAPLHEPHQYNGARWAMSIDLSKCTGCSACVVACQAENNIPVVGKAEVARGREMHWIRIDRYFRGDPEQATVSHQPLTCHHCENAPCETVCPVNATVHDSEGLNAMVYNRCVGTRYCANNCPFKVRRFNWFYNHHGPHHPRSGQTGPVLTQGREVTILERMAYNPDVTVRSRGVMEKCSFCLQRINRAKIVYKNEKLPVPDGAVVPACAQVCPSEAIVFGDLAVAGSAVSKAHDDARSYTILDELNVKPRTKYMARLKNWALAAADSPAAPGSSDTHH